MGKKTLLIMRHGKSSWQKAGEDDFTRALLPLGVERTEIVGKQLLKERVLPQIIISSPAERAVRTAFCLADTIKLNHDAISTNESLYFKTVNDYFDALYSAPEDVSKIMIVGHNPMITEFANFFLSQKIDNLPTSGILALESDADNWTAFVLSFRRVLFHLIPKNIKNEK
jgi:phosphohistidine phosphatase